MYGLAEISKANGWNMAIVGAFIVITGLCILSFLVSHLHYLSDLLTKKIVSFEKFFLFKTNKITMEIKTVNNFEETLELYRSFSSKLGNSFLLSDLYKISEEEGLTHPYISIRNFRNSGDLLSMGQGYFSWK